MRRNNSACDHRPDHGRSALRLLTLTSVLAMAVLLPAQADAGLLGSGKSVQAFYYNGVFAGPEGEIPMGASTSDPASLATAVDYPAGAADGSTIHVGDTQIIITNVLSGNPPFCFHNTPGNACTDVIDGFDFKFVGEDILGASIDPATAADFQPVTGTFQGNTHNGLQLLSSNEVQVDVTGDAPNVNDELIIDLSFSTTLPPPSTVPEPATLAVVVSAIAGIAVVRRRPKS